MYYLYSDVYIDPIEKQYKKIITTTKYPESLSDIILRIRVPNTYADKIKRTEGSCLYAFKSFTDSNKPLEVDDLPLLISFLYERNLQINYDVSKLLSKSLQRKILIVYQ